MAPSENLQRKLQQLGMAYDLKKDAPAAGGRGKHTVRLFFPRPPFGGARFAAHLVAPDAYNFTGRVLGMGGENLRHIVAQTGCFVSIHDSAGALKGRHPDPTDPGIHAVLAADSMAKIERAAAMVAQQLRPLNGRFKPLALRSGVDARLEVAELPAATRAGAGKAGAARLAAASEGGAAAAPARAAETSARPAELDWGTSGCEFRLYFPAAPFDADAEFLAHRVGAGYNFAGRVLGVGGGTLQAMKAQSRATMEVWDGQGHLRGRHPDVLDSQQHVYICASSVESVERAAQLVMDLLCPPNRRFLPFTVTNRGSARLRLQPLEPPPLPGAAPLGLPSPQPQSPGSPTRPLEGAAAPPPPPPPQAVAAGDWPALGATTAPAARHAPAASAGAAALDSRAPPHQPPSPPPGARLPLSARQPGAVAGASPAASADAGGAVNPPSAATISDTAAPPSPQRPAPSVYTLFGNLEGFAPAPPAPLDPKPLPAVASGSSPAAMAGPTAWDGAAGAVVSAACTGALPPGSGAAHDEVTELMSLLLT